MRAKRELTIDYISPDAQGLPEQWTTRDAYLAELPEADRDYVYCDHCRSTLVVRPFLYEGVLYLECQACRFTYKNNGVVKEIFKAYSG